MFFQYWLPGLEKAEEKPHKYELEYTTLSRKKLHPAGGEPLMPLKELPKALRKAVDVDVESDLKGKKWKKYVPYGMEDLTIKRWLKLGRRLGEDDEKEVRAVFKRFMFQGQV